ncbi:MAG TPA: MOSC N-terminal beta barrel domain-containing protein [Tepidisphaeraceae bacterium]|jgi:uncharacterized protein YcbX|nr:MOSC N-terminal beta barrel domain-containing protein [Tepidisphaeraceae bacterium]
MGIDVPHLARILLFPIKSMEPVAVEQARVLKGGSLENDRVLAFFDAEGKFVNGKRCPAVHKLRAAFDPAMRTLRLAVPETEREATFHVDRERQAMEQWLGEYFGFTVFVKENRAGGWPDDTDSPGPTLISSATLREVAGWFGGLSVEQVRLRFRTNLEIECPEAFWEDRLYGPPGICVRFRIGDVLIDGVNPCQRCAVPPRDPATGQPYADFANTFRTRREQTLPLWAERSRFNHFYRLAINTRIPAGQTGKVLRVGDDVAVIGPAGP